MDQKRPGGGARSAAVVTGLLCFMAAKYIRNPGSARATTKRQPVGAGRRWAGGLRPWVRPGGAELSDRAKGTS